IIKPSGPKGKTQKKRSTRMGCFSSSILAVVYPQGTIQAALAEAQGATVVKPTGAPGDHMDKLTTAVEGTIGRTAELRELRNRTDFAKASEAIKKARSLKSTTSPGGRRLRCRSY